MLNEPSKKTKISKTKTKAELKLKVLDKKITNLGPDEKPEIKKIKKQENIPTELFLFLKL